MNFIARLFSRSPTPQYRYTLIDILNDKIARENENRKEFQRALNIYNYEIKQYEDHPDDPALPQLMATRNEYEERLKKSNEEIYKFEEQLDEENRQQEKTEHQQKIIEGNQEREGWLDGRKNGVGRAGGKSKKRKNKKNTKTKTKKNKSRQRLKKRR